MTEQIEYDGRVSAFGKPGSRHWFYFRQNGVTYSIRFRGFKLIPKPINYNYEIHLQRHAAALERSGRPSAQFTLKANVESVEPEGDLIRVQFCLRGPFNQVFTAVLYPLKEYGADLGIGINAVMTRLPVHKYIEKERIGV